LFPRYLINFDCKTHLCFDFIIIGTGIAGMYSALHLSEHGRVLLISKDNFPAGNSIYAQGGIAAAIDEKDSPTLHLKDTLSAGAGLCDIKAVKTLVEEGPVHIQNLLKMGVPFDRSSKKISLTQEGAHGIPRILHAGGDATGKVVCKVLSEQLQNKANVEILKNTMAVDLISQANKCLGVLVLTQEHQPNVIYARAVILATGGIGQLYEKTTNAPGVTGDGIAMSVRIGARVADMEFVQFHPTMLNSEKLRGFLISEAVRGEGAVLRNHNGERFMPKFHPLADLAPRDIVTRAIFTQMLESSSQVYLDATGFAKNFFKSRFPTIYNTCTSLGIDPSSDMIPVTPGAHYLMGGVKTDTWGRTNISGLYACGEVACTGVHGANRLASNSLLEGLVFGYRTAKAASLEDTSYDKSNIESLNYTKQKTKKLDSQEYDKLLKQSMQENVGIIRDAQDLKKHLNLLQMVFPFLDHDLQSKEGIEFQNKVIVSYMVTQAAMARNISCGAHYRTNSLPKDKSS